MVHFSIGATAVGAVFKDGVILAADRRIAYGPFILSKSGRKVFKITDFVGMACAGLLSDFQRLERIIKANIALYEMNNRRYASSSVVAKLVSIVLFSNRTMPLYLEALVGGKDRDKFSLFSLDAVGSLSKEKYAAIGTGAELAISILEKNYSEDMSLKEGESLIVSAMKAAISRDAVTGDGIDLLIISDEGAESKFIKV